METFGFIKLKSPPIADGCEYSIQGKRSEMEDETIYARWFYQSEATKTPIMIRMYGVFDGHGGKDASKLVSQLLPNIIKDQLQNAIITRRDQVKIAISQSFQKMQHFMQSNYSKKFQKQGTTAVIILRIKNTIYCANTGDSRGVLCSLVGSDGQSEVADLSRDHKPNLPDEHTRIVKQGGFVNPPSAQEIPRVWDITGKKIALATSRSLGDLESLTTSGEYLVSPFPEITVNTLKKNEKGFIILACDGVWDVIESPQACRVVKQELKKKTKNAMDACKAIVHLAYNKGSTDNITAMVILL